MTGAIRRKTTNIAEINNIALTVASQPSATWNRLRHAATAVVAAVRRTTVMPRRHAALATAAQAEMPRNTRNIPSANARLGQKKPQYRWFTP